MKVFTNHLKQTFFHLHFLLFITGFFIAGYLFCSFQADYENRLFKTMALEVRTGEELAGQDQVLKKALHTTFNLLEARGKIFINRETGGFLDDVIHPLSADMMTAEGACGSYSAVLCKLVNTMGFATRFAQMKVDGKYGGHIVMEAKTNHGWVVLDPIFNVCFTKPGGALAGFNDVSANWQLYTKQLPAGYSLRYNYAAVRYTNWDKIPVVMPVIRKILSLFMSENEIQEISLRNYFLNKYEVCGNILLVLIFPLSFIIIVKKTGYRFSFKPRWRSIIMQPANVQRSHANA